MKSLGIGRRQQAQIWQILAAILHLGNIQFKDVFTAKETCSIKNFPQLESVAEMLGLNATSLQNVLTSRTRFIGKDHVTEYLSAKEAEVQRDYFARALYGACFSWIIEQINQHLCSPDSNWSNFVSILEIPGFAGANSNVRNDFNRLMVNYANEKLYAHTMSELFDSSRESFTAQGIPFPEIKYAKNTEVLEALVHGKNGILVDIDSNSISRIPDSTIVEKIYEKYLKGGVLVSASSKNLSRSFGIHHYGGIVEYDCKGFGDSDRDVLQSDFVTLIRGDPEVPGTVNQFLRSLFSDKLISTRRACDNSAVSATPRGRTPSLRRKVSQKLNLDDEYETLDTSSTVGHSFRSDISLVFDTLCSTQPWFIFCINPFVAGKSSVETIKRQVISYDIQSLPNIPSTIYTASYSFEEFVVRYKAVLSLYDQDPKGACSTMIRYKNWNDSDVMIGQTSIFLAEKNWLELELLLIEKEEEAEAAKNPKPVIAVLSPSSSSPKAFRLPYADSVDGSDFSDDSASHFGSEFEFEFPASKAFDDIEMGNIIKPYQNNGQSVPKAAITTPPPKEMTNLRRNWLCCTWTSSFCFLPVCLRACGKMKDKDRQLAWREKFALCLIIFFMNILVLFVIIGTGYIICPRTSSKSPGQVSELNNPNKNPAVHMYGKYYILPGQVAKHVSNYMPAQYASNQYWSSAILGQDVSYMFPKLRFAVSSGYCSIAIPASFRLLQDVEPTSPWLQHGVNTGVQTDFLPALDRNFLAGKLVIDTAYLNDQIAKDSNGYTRYIVINDKVYNLSPFYNIALNPSQSRSFFLGEYFTQVANFYTAGQTVGDASSAMARLKTTDPTQYNNVMQCLDSLFLAGGVDHRNDLICLIPNWILLAFSIILVSVIGFKFVAALQFRGKPTPEDHDKFVICQVPCYTEGETSLHRTLDSLANLRYDDKHKLLFVVCDGMIIGSGNDRPTPRIVLDLLGHDPLDDPGSHSYQSLGDGNNQLNYGKVYSGLYQHNGHIVPYIVVVKVGKPSERKKPGNR
jgi:chitin synthase